MIIFFPITIPKICEEPFTSSDQIKIPFKSQTHDPKPSTRTKCFSYTKSLTLLKMETLGTGFNLTPIISIQP